MSHSTFCTYALGVDQRLRTEKLTDAQRKAFRKASEQNHRRCSDKIAEYCDCKCHRPVNLDLPDLEWSRITEVSASGYARRSATPASVQGSVRKPGKPRRSQSPRPPRLYGAGRGYYILDGATGKLHWLTGTLRAVRKAYPRGWIIHFDPLRLGNGFEWTPDRGWIWPASDDLPLAGLDKVAASATMPWTIDYVHRAHLADMSRQPAEAAWSDVTSGTSQETFETDPALEQEKQ